MNILIGNDKNIAVSWTIALVPLYSAYRVLFFLKSWSKINETITQFEMALQSIMCHYVIVCYGTTQGRPDQMDHSIQQGDDIDNKMPLQDHVFIKKIVRSDIGRAIVIATMSFKRVWNIMW